MLTPTPGGILPLLVILGLLAFSTSGEIVGDVPLNYTHVCDAGRFADLGLDISDFTYCDKSLPYDARVKDLVQRMTLTEKVQQLGDKTTGVGRIGLPAYEWWSEALHGVSNVGPGTVFGGAAPRATSFPTVILNAAAFNKTLWKSIGKVVSTEARAMYNMGQAGLTYWSPNINVVRDPRWGRTLETPGEDPYVVGSWAINYVRGLQDIDGTENVTDLNSRPLKVSACCKHYSAYDVDNWMGVDRYHFDARVTTQDMTETFQVPFKMCVKEGDVSSVMCSYNRVNGIPTCADPVLLKGTIRGDWNLHGYIVSDCDSVEVMVDAAKWNGDTPVDAVSQTLKAGLDMDCGTFYPQNLAGAVYQGQIGESEIDTALTHNYIVLMRLGFFDGIPSLASLGKTDVCAKEHITLAEEAAREGIVLLKNNETLPLSSHRYKKLAAIGPHANATAAMIGNYAGIPCRYISPIEGLSVYGQVTYEKGCSDVACKNDTLTFTAMEAAKTADVTILFMGLDLTVEAESLDRKDLLLPGYQNQLIQEVAEVAQGPVILVIMSAGGVDISFAKDHPKIQAILWAGYPGEEGGRAIADVIFGKYNPGGRLPVTWFKNDYVDQLPMTSMRLRPDENFGYPGRTYRFFDGPTVYPFGYGLSYTQFEYETMLANEGMKPVTMKINKHHVCRHVNFTDGYSSPSPCPAVAVEDLPCDERFVFRVRVKNVGKIDGEEVVMVYSKPPEGVKGTYLRRLIGFERVFVPAGQSKEVKFSFAACESLVTVDAVGYKNLIAGVHTIAFGDDLVNGHVKVDFNREK